MNQTEDVVAALAGVDLVRLAAWMDGQGLGSGPCQDVVHLTGGTQNVLLRFRRADRTYVLRRPPEHLRSNSNETMRREARVLSAIAETPVPHARLIAACPDEGVLGAAFYLMEPVEGFNATTGLPALHAASKATRRRMGLALVEGVATLGALDYREIGLDGFGRPDQYLLRQVERWQSQLASYAQYPDWTGPKQIPGVDKVAAWLTAHRPASFLPALVHGDYHLANVMFRFDGPELAAIVDWELATIGDPLLDLGWLLATWPEGDPPGVECVAAAPWQGFPSADDLVEHYRPRTERDLSAIGWYEVMASFKLGIVLEGTHARACAGLAPSETGERLHAKTIGHFERALRTIH
jgi:aminoglycoside phosphotransferase (APT) family kinase protein